MARDKFFVKICGVTRVEDAEFAVSAGADAVGIVFYSKSPRFVDRETAKKIAGRVRRMKGSVVGVFVNEDPRVVDYMARYLPLDMVQLHGDESPEEFAGFGVPIIKAFRVKDTLPLEEMRKWAGRAHLFLLEGYSIHYGGAGAVLDLSTMKRVHFPYPFILAGGLTPENVAEKIKQVRPFGVDASSGVEKSPGVKDPEKVKTFIENARKAAGEIYTD